MNNIQYFELGKSVDPKEVGVKDLYQITDIIGGFDKDTLNQYWSLNRRKLIENMPDIEHFVLAKGAKVTDVLSNMFLKVSQGLFVNEKVKMLLDEVTISNFKLYESRIQHNEIMLRYFFYQVSESPELIDYEKSEFKITDVLGLEEMGSITFKSDQEYYEKCKEIGANSVGYDVVKLEKNYDLFRLPWEFNLCISERLNTLLVESGVTGIDIKPSKIQFFLD